MRLFVAIQIPDDILTELTGLRGHLGGFRWITRENMHLTLQFLGEVDDRQFDVLCEALDRVPMNRLVIRIRGLGSFGPSAEPRVLWAGVEPAPDLLRLQRSIRAELRRIIRLEHQKFIPHVTLARATRRETMGLHGYLLEREQAVDLVFETEQFHLFSSTLLPAGARYEIEASFPLTL